MYRTRRCVRAWQREESTRTTDSRRAHRENPTADRAPACTIRPSPPGRRPRPPDAAPPPRGTQQYRRHRRRRHHRRCHRDGLYSTQWVLLTAYLRRTPFFHRDICIHFYLSNSFFPSPVFFYRIYHYVLLLYLNIINHFLFDSREKRRHVIITTFGFFSRSTLPGIDYPTFRVRASFLIFRTHPPPADRHILTPHDEYTLFRCLGVYRGPCSRVTPTFVRVDFQAIHTVRLFPFFVFFNNAKNIFLKKI